MTLDQAARLERMESQLSQLVVTVTQLDTKLGSRGETCPHQVDIARNSNNRATILEIKATVEKLQGKLHKVEIKLAGWAVLISLLSSAISLVVAQLVKGAFA